MKLSLQYPHLSDRGVVRSTDEFLEVGQAVGHGVGIHQLSLDVRLSSLLTCHLQILHQVLPVACELVVMEGDGGGWMTKLKIVIMKKLLKYH